MSLRVLGCSGAFEADRRTTAFLLDPHVLIDAGSGVGDLGLQELVDIDHILLSHAHLDHVLGVPLLADAVQRQRSRTGRGPVTVHALPETLAALRQHLFNGVIWPDFTRLPTPAAPALRFSAVQVGDRLELAGRNLQVLSATHTVPACGFAVEGARGWWVYTGDTGPNPALADELQSLSGGVQHLVIEATFGNAEAPLAALAEHLCPATLLPMLAPLSALSQPSGHGPAQTPTIWLTHLKPDQEAAVVHELQTSGTGLETRLLQRGQVFHLG